MNRRINYSIRYLLICLEGKAEDLYKRILTLSEKMLGDAPALLPERRDEPSWRSRGTFIGNRRANYSIRYLLIDLEGKFAKSFQWSEAIQDPKIVRHGSLEQVTDLIWSGVASRTLAVSKSLFCFSLLMFIIGQSILEQM